MVSIFLEMVDETAGEPTRHVVEAPATIGRGAECDLRLDPTNRALSRLHLEVVAEGEDVFVVNRASNPGTTRHGDGALSKDERVALPESGTLVFLLMGAEVRVGRAGALSVRVTAAGADAPAEDLGTHALSAARAVLVRSGPPALVTAMEPGDWTPPEADAPPEAQIAVYLDRGQPTLAVLVRLPNQPVMIDGGELTTNSAYLRPLEAVTHGSLQLELLEEGLDYRRCPACAVLNAPGRSACRICGTAFAAAPVVDEATGPASTEAADVAEKRVDEARGAEAHAGDETPPAAAMAPEEPATGNPAA